jgi:hypothetical protein
VVIVPSVRPANIQVLNGSTVRISFDAQPGATYELLSTEDLNAPEWKKLFRWNPVDEAQVSTSIWTLMAAQRFFRIESN